MLQFMSDINFFLEGGALKDLREIIVNFSILLNRILLVNPGLELSAEAYKLAIFYQQEQLKKFDLQPKCSSCFNRLESGSNIFIILYYSYIISLFE